MERRRAIAYVRVSTEKQTDHGVSLQAQRTKLEQYATVYDLDLVDVVVDAGVSAKSLDRPGLSRALRALQRGEAEGLLVVKLDRLTRSVRDLGELVEGYFAKGDVALMSVSERIDTSTASGRLVLNVLASVSQWEREAVGERTSAAMQYKASKGEYTGGRARYGFRVGADGVTLEADPKEQEALQVTHALREEGYSYREIAAALTARGFRSRTGGTFGPSSISRFLKESAHA